MGPKTHIFDQKSVAGRPRILTIMMRQGAAEIGAALVRKRAAKLKRHLLNSAMIAT